MKAQGVLRGFSTLKVHNTKLRNRLSAERLNKLVFIHINQHVLTQGPRTLHQVKEKEIVQLERNLALLIEEEYLHSQWAQVQFSHDDMEDTLSGDEATAVTDRNSGS
jgi:hypothetical protein